jgi:hypothetical protein
VRTAAKIDQHSPLREHPRPAAPHNPSRATQNRLTNTVYGILYIRKAALIRSIMRGHPATEAGKNSPSCSEQYETEQIRNTKTRHGPQGTTEGHHKYHDKTC